MRFTRPLDYADPLQAVEAVVVKKGKAILKKVPSEEVGSEEVKAKFSFYGMGGADPFAIKEGIRFPLPYYIGYPACGSWLRIP